MSSLRKMKIFTALLLFAMALLLLIPVFHADSHSVYIIPVEAEVERGLQAFIDRGIEEAEEADAGAIIFEIDTPGGFVDAADGIARLLQDTDIETIAYINQDALSAGAFLALNADEIYMHPSARMGAAQVIDQAGNAAADKADSAWRSSMVNAAESSDRETEYALAMADASIDLPEYRAGEGELLTLRAREAEEVGYSEGTVSSIEELLELKGLPNRAKSSTPAGSKRSNRPERSNRKQHEKRRSLNKRRL